MICTDESKTPKLLKVTLSLINQTICSEHHPPDRKLNSGLQDGQICAVDPGFKMDTCLGDSGGPLQIKLLGFNRLNPFLIGVTSFGKSCGTETPGVYTRIYSYVDWIEEITQGDFEPLKCAHRYYSYRELEPDILNLQLKEDEGDFGNVAASKSHFQLYHSFNHRGATDPGNCGVVFIHEEYTLTSASCVSIISPKAVVAMNSYDDPLRFKVDLPIFHPLYKRGSTNHDIALLKLIEPIQ